MDYNVFFSTFALEVSAFCYKQRKAYRPRNTLRLPSALHLSGARQTIVRRAPFYDFAVSYHETRSEQSLKLLRAFIAFEPTFRSA